MSRLLVGAAPHHALATVAKTPAISLRTESLSAAHPSPRLLDRPGGRIAYDDLGAGPLVVMVPGLGDVRAEYRFLAPRLVEAGFRVVTMDLRGHGQSTANWSDHSCAAIGSDVVALVDSLAAGPAVLIGTSMGAGAVAWAAAEAPRLTAGLVLIGPFVREIPSSSRVKTLLQKSVVAAAFHGPWAPSAWGLYYASLYPTAKPADFAAYRTALVANLAEPGRMGALRAMLRSPKSDVEARLAEVRAPTLVVMGTKDPDFADPIAEARTVADLLHGSVHAVAGAGHYPHAEMPEIVAPAVLDFLRRNDARA